MAIFRRIALVLKWPLWLLGCCALPFIFVAWAPWIGCKPISGLAAEYLAAPPVPAGARCYTIEHGRYYFSGHQTVAQNPVPFILLTIAFAACCALASWWPWFCDSMRSRRSWRRARAVSAS